MEHEVEEELNGQAEHLLVHLLLEEVEHLVDERERLLDDGVVYLLERKQHAFLEDVLHVVKEILLGLYLKVVLDLVRLVAPEDGIEDDVVELVQDEVPQQVVVVWDVPEEAGEEREEDVDLEVLRALLVFDSVPQVFQQVDDANHALEVVQGNAGVPSPVVDGVVLLELLVLLEDFDVFTNARFDDLGFNVGLRA